MRGTYKKQVQSTAKRAFLYVLTCFACCLISPPFPFKGQLENRLTLGFASYFTSLAYGHAQKPHSVWKLLKSIILPTFDCSMKNKDGKFSVSFSVWKMRHFWVTFKHYEMVRIDRYFRFRPPNFTRKAHCALARSHRDKSRVRSKWLSLLEKGQFSGILAL